MVKNEEIFMVSPLNPGTVHTYESLMKVIVHEFTHVLVGKINSNTDMYLNEGIAVVEGNQMNINMKNYLKEAINLNKLPTIDEMINSFDDLNQPYVVSGGFVEFLINTYGYDKVVEIISEPHNIESITENSKDILLETWIEYIVKSY